MATKAQIEGVKAIASAEYCRLNQANLNQPERLVLHPSLDGVTKLKRAATSSSLEGDEMTDIPCVFMREFEHWFRLAREAGQLAFKWCNVAENDEIQRPMISLTVSAAVVWPKKASDDSPKKVASCRTVKSWYEGDWTALARRVPLSGLDDKWRTRCQHHSLRKSSFYHLPILAQHDCFKFLVIPKFYCRRSLSSQARRLLASNFHSEHEHCSLSRWTWIASCLIPAMERDGSLTGRRPDETETVEL